MATANVDAKSLANQITVTVRLNRFDQWKFRLWIAMKLIKLAGWIAWVNVGLEEEIQEPWLYYCPSCGRDIAAFKDTIMVVCPHCNYQSLVVDPERPRLFKPLQSDLEVCDFGCHYTEPYGFVPMADCPIHD